LSPTFALNVLSEVYGSFYDDKSQYWCVQLVGLEELEKLARQVALIKVTRALSLF
jgi:hypothetical protein